MEIIVKKPHDLDLFLLENMKQDFQLGQKNFFIPAGGTPKSFYELLDKNDSNEIKQTKFWQIDDIITGKHKFEFWKFFEKHLPNKLHQVIRINPKISPPQHFSVFLGLGLNGHVAFHEPYLDLGFSFGEVELSDITIDYLNLEQATRGLSFGLGTFLKAKNIYIMIKGEHKIPVLKKLFKKDIDIPATHLLAHPNIKILIDDETWTNFIK